MRIYQLTGWEERVMYTNRLKHRRWLERTYQTAFGYPAPSRDGGGESGRISALTRAIFTGVPLGQPGIEGTLGRSVFRRGLRDVS